MIIFKYPYFDTNVIDIKEQLDELTVDYKALKDSVVLDLTLTEGDNTITGANAIKTYLDQLKSELQKWHYCDC